MLDNLSPQVHGDAELDDDGWPVYLDPRARRIRGDLLDEGVFEQSIEGVTHLAHLAASVGVGQSMTNIVDYTRNNVMTAAVMLEMLSRKPHTIETDRGRLVDVDLRRRRVRARIGQCAGVSDAAQPTNSLPTGVGSWSTGNETLTPLPTTEDKLLQPASIYAVNKRDHEEMFLSVGRALEIPTVALRLFNAYGSRQALSNPYTGVAAIFISRLLNDQPPLVFEDGEQRRDFVHVQDVAEAFADGAGQRPARLGRLQRRQRKADHRHGDGPGAGAPAAQEHRPRNHEQVSRRRHPALLCRHHEDRNACSVSSLGARSRREWPS